MGKLPFFLTNFEPYRYRVSAKNKGELIFSFAIGKRLLDAGCGNGWISRYARLRGYRPIGVDISSHVIKMNRLYSRLSKTKPIDIRKASLDRLPFRSASFETVIACEVIEHLPQRVLIKTMAELKRVLVPSGRLIITVPTPLYGLVYDRLLHRFTHHGRFSYASRAERSIKKQAPKFRYEMTARDVHHQQFTVAKMEQLLTRFGFHLIRRGNAEVLTPFVRSIDNLFGLPGPLVTLASFLERILIKIVPMALGTDWIFVAEKPRLSD